MELPQKMIELLENIWAVYLDTAFWLLIGLLAAGLVKTYIPEDAMMRWLGGRGFSAIGRAALLGAPLPLCSCGVLPAALGLRRSGASKEATVSFLISTPETSIDSVAVTYALMGPVMAVYRPIAAVFSAIVTGLATTFVDEPENTPKIVAADCCGDVSTQTTDSCCGSSEAGQESSCCSGNTPTLKESRFLRALQYAGADLLDDISRWMGIGIVIAGLMSTVIPDGWLAQWGQGLFAMLVMLLVGIPMYICAVASTPVAAGLILAGVSPGTVLVFLLVGPATNIAGLILIHKELGLSVTLVYLAGLAVASVFMGLALDSLLASTELAVIVDMGMAHQMLPDVISYGSAVLLLLLVYPPLRRLLFPALQQVRAKV
jgi:uncharacterized membrane protein YraQ (UPF0718 family)